MSYGEGNAESHPFPGGKNDHVQATVCPRDTCDHRMTTLRLLCVRLLRVSQAARGVFVCVWFTVLLGALLHSLKKNLRSTD